MRPRPTTRFALLVLLLAPVAGAGEERFPIVTEPALMLSQPPLSTDAGARNLSSLLRAVPHAVDPLLLRLNPNREHLWFERAATALTLELPLVLSTTWLQHEGFGHAARCREYRKSCAFTVAFPPPFSFDGSANAAYIDVEQEGPFFAAIFLPGGRHAEQELTDELVRKGIESGVWPRTSALYVSAQAYYLARELIAPSQSSDRARYYAALPAANPRLTWYAYPRNINLLSFAWRALDPLLWQSLYDYFVRWLIHGEEQLTLDLIPGPLVGVIRPRVIERHTGVDFGLEATWRMNGRVWEAGLFLPTKAGLGGASVSLDAPLPSFARNLELRGRIGLWPLEPYPFPMGGAELDATWWLTPALGLTTRLGAKMPGYWNGTTFDMTAYGQLGVELRP